MLTNLVMPCFHLHRSTATSKTLRWFDVLAWGRLIFHLASDLFRVRWYQDWKESICDQVYNLMEAFFTGRARSAEKSLLPDLRALEKICSFWMCTVKQGQHYCCTSRQGCFRFWSGMKAGEAWWSKGISLKARCGAVFRVYPLKLALCI